ncbi:uncharacterized protein LOC129722407 [Wyeomyia smithii]|uniref:uncharacterized protein LOC129722407 n=1 Tax=Wyeomyia smithii TaxID=174621 RepID=UPI002467C182|nr:uncharacterized protein LOC129722407 [Wyeomyia smithii]
MNGTFEVKVVSTWMLLILCHLAYVYCAKHEAGSRALTQNEKESARLNPVYYAQMWYRTWTFPATLALAWIPIVVVVVYCYLEPALIGAQAIKSQESESGYHGPIIIDGHVESYGSPPLHKWFHKWG